MYFPKYITINYQRLILLSLLKTVECPIKASPVKFDLDNAELNACGVH